MARAVKPFFIPPRDSGEGGPRVARWEGRGTQRVAASFTIPVRHHPPVAPTRSKRFSPPRRHIHFCSPKKEREAERRLARNKRTAPVTGSSRDPLYEDPSPFGAPLRIDETFVSTRPGPALPGITGSTRGLHSLSGTSAVGTLQSEHAPDGHDAHAACEQK